MPRGKQEPSLKKKPFPRIPQKTSKLKGTFPNKKHPKTGPSVQRIIEVLLRTGGMKSRASKILGCDLGTIGNRMREFPEIANALVEAENQRLDQAEMSLDRNIKNGVQKAIEFFLKNKGKARGYGRDNDQDQEMDLNIVIEKFQKALEETKPEFPMPPVIEVNRVIS